MTRTAVSRFLDLRALAALEHLRFATRQRIEGPFSGRHRSRRQGGAGEFADFREYCDGEDLRRLDWKVLARTGRAYTRLYQDENNLRCTIVLDASGSMAFGSKCTKLEYAQFFATALATIIGRQQDQVGLAMISDAISEFFAPGGTAGHVVRIQEAIERLVPRPATNLAEGLRTLYPRLTRRGVLLLISDFLVDDLDAVFAGVRLFRHRGWEVIALQIVHPEEERLPEGAAYRFEGLENEGRVDCSPTEVRELYEKAFRDHGAAVRTSALAAGCDFRRASTATPYLQTLGGFLVERAG